MKTLAKSIKVSSGKLFVSEHENPFWESLYEVSNPDVFKKYAVGGVAFFLNECLWSQLDKYNGKVYAAPDGMTFELNDFCIPDCDCRHKCHLKAICSFTSESEATFYCKEQNTIGYTCEDGQCDACAKMDVEATTEGENKPDFEALAKILSDNIKFSGQIDGYLIHGAIEKIVDWHKSKVSKLEQEIKTLRQQLEKPCGHCGFEVKNE